MLDEIKSMSISKGSSLLPIGSVLLVDFISQPLMVYGRKQRQSSNEEIWDYVACPYPQGHISEESNVFFNHLQIDEIIFKGLETDGDKAMRDKLCELFDEEVSNEEDY